MIWRILSAAAIVASVAAVPAGGSPSSGAVAPEPFTLPGQKDKPSQVPTTSVTEGCGGVCEGKGCPTGWRALGDKSYTKVTMEGKEMKFDSEKDAKKEAKALSALTGNMVCKCVCIKDSKEDGSGGGGGGDTAAADKASAEAEKREGQQLAANPKQQEEVPAQQASAVLSKEKAAQEAKAGDSSSSAAAGADAAVSAGSTASIAPSSGPNPAGEMYGQCTFVANLHVRKCGGTSVRELFTGMEGWERSGQEAGLTYCSSMREHAEAATPGKKKWVEVHCEENLKTFNVGVALLRQKLEPLGCKVVSTLLLRNPVDQGVSEWLYFFKDQVDGMRESGNPMSWATDYIAWGKAHTEEELRLLTTPDATTPPDDTVWEAVEEGSKGTPLPGIKSCDAALALVHSEMAKVDVVATMDTPEEFASFWVSLSKKAGFEPETDLSQQLFNTHGETAMEPDVSPEEREDLYKANACSQQVVEVARARNRDAFTSLLGSTAPASSKVSQLIERWGGADRVAKALRERERPSQGHAQGHVALRGAALAFSNSTMLKKSPQ